MTRFKGHHDEVCGRGTPCTELTSQEALNYFDVGPPYILDKHDFKQIAPLWWEYMQKGYKVADNCNEAMTIAMDPNKPNQKMSAAQVTNSFGMNCCTDKKAACWKGAASRAALAPSHHHRTLLSWGGRPLPSGGGGGQPVALSQLHPQHCRPNRSSLPPHPRFGQPCRRLPRPPLSRRVAMAPPAGWQITPECAPTRASTPAAPRSMAPRRAIR